MRARKRPRLSRRSSSSPTSTCGGVDHGAAVAQVYRHRVSTLEHLERRDASPGAPPAPPARRSRRPSARSIAAPSRTAAAATAARLRSAIARGAASPNRAATASTRHPHSRDARAHRLRQMERDALRPKRSARASAPGGTEVRAQRADVAAPIAEVRGERRRQLGRRFIRALARLAQRRARIAQARVEMVYAAAMVRQRADDGAVERRRGLVQPPAQLGLVRHHELRGGGRRRRAHVGDEIGDGVVDFMADGRNHRNRERWIARATVSSLKAHRSSSEPPPRPTIITSARRVGVEVIDRLRDFGRRARALHARRPDDELQIRIAGEQDASRCRAAPRRRAPSRLRPPRQKR